MFDRLGTIIGLFLVLLFAVGLGMALIRSGESPASGDPSVSAEQPEPSASTEPARDVVVAATYTKRSVVVPTARVRSGPGASFEIRGSISQGEDVLVARTSGGWARVRFDNSPTGHGWVRGDLIGMDLSAKRATTARAGGFASACTETSIEDFGALIYRLEPSVKSAYVNDLWYSMAFDQKQAFVLYLSKCHGIPRVRSARDGKTLARHGLLGVSIEE